MLGAHARRPLDPIFGADYGSVVSSRDKQLQDLLEWLRVNDPVAGIGIKNDEKSVG